MQRDRLLAEARKEECEAEKRLRSAIDAMQPDIKAGRLSGVEPLDRVRPLQEDLDEKRLARMALERDRKMLQRGIRRGVAIMFAIFFFFGASRYIFGRSTSGNDRYFAIFLFAILGCSAVWYAWRCSVIPDLGEEEKID